MIRQLPVFKGYTVDARLKEFRYFHKNGELVTWPFNCELGDKLLTQYIRTLDVNSEEFKEIAYAIC